MSIKTISLKDEVGKIILRNSSLERKTISVLTDDELKLKKYNTAISNFKRNLMGLCGYETIKTSSELENALYNSNLCSSKKESDKLLNELRNSDLEYELSNISYTSGNKVLRFEMVNDLGEEKYRIRRLYHD